MGLLSSSDGALLDNRHDPLHRGGVQYVAWLRCLNTAVSTSPFLRTTLLFGVLHRHHLDLDQKAGIGECGDADHGSRRQIRLAAAENWV